MPVVFIPPSLRSLTGGVDRVEVSAATVREAIEELDERFAGFRDRVCAEGDLKPVLAISIDGNVTSLGLLGKLSADSEVHILPAIGGG